MGLGQVFRAKREYDAAEAILERALAIRRAAYSERKAEIADVLIELGLVYWHLDRNEEAITAFEETLAIRQAVGDEEGAGAALLNLSMPYWDLGDREKSEEALNRARDIFERTVQRHSAMYAELLFVVAGHYRNAERLREALTALEEAATLFERHGAIGRLQAVLDFETQLLLEIDDEETEARLLRALETRRRIYGHKHVAVARVLNALGLVYRSLERYDESIRALQEALSTYEALGNERGAAGALLNLCLAYSDSGDDKKARDALSRGEEIYERTVERDSAEFAELLFIKAVRYLNLGKPREAADQARGAARLFERHGRQDRQIQVLKFLVYIAEETGDERLSTEARKQLAELGQAPERNADGPREPEKEAGEEGPEQGSGQGRGTRGHRRPETRRRGPHEPSLPADGWLVAEASARRVIRKTGRFCIVETSAGERCAVDVVAFVDAYLMAFGQIFLGKFVIDERLFVRVFADEEEFLQRYRQVYEEDGDAARNALYSPSERETWVTLTQLEGGLARNLSLETVKHELTHHMLHFYTGRDSLPPWFTEGAACFFQYWMTSQTVRENIDANFERARSGDFGYFPEEVCEAYGSERWLTPARLMGLDYDSFHSEDSPAEMLHYSESWALVNFLATTKAGQRFFNEILVALRQGKPFSALVDPRSFDALKRAWNADIENRVLPVLEAQGR